MDVIVHGPTTPSTPTQMNQASVGADGALWVSASKTSTATSAVVTVDSLATVLAANTSRRKFILQNVSAVAVYVKLGTGASSTDYSFILQAGTAAADGKGGAYDGTSYTGAITAIAASGTGNKVAVVEL